jgi:2-dehydro-3-deoxygalactonokinase
MTAPTDSAVLIAVDWGTTRLRAMLLAADGAVLAERQSDAGIGTLSGGFEAAFERIVEGWPPVPAIMAGMIGSRQGWREAPYAGLPATAAALADGLVRFSTSAGRPVAIVPGVMLRSPLRDGDVIRGEETQIVGLVDGEPGFSGIAIHPGTHSKWIGVSAGAITDFQTFMTGEMFDLLSRQSFLRHSVEDGGGDLAAMDEFALGVRRTAAEGLPFLAAIFSVRARQLLDAVPKAQNLAYLSGLLIGGEIAAARASIGDFAGSDLRIVGARSLARAYRRAFELLGRDVAVLDGAEMVAAGLWHLARTAGLVTGKPSP